MRTVSGADNKQPTSSRTDFTDAVKIEVANSSDVLTDLSASAVSLEYHEGTDEIVAAATIVFRRGTGASSLVPLMLTPSPIALGRRVVVSINPGSGTYREVFRGQIDAHSTPDRFGDVTIECLDRAGIASRTWIETARQYSTTAGASLDTVMQSVVTDNMTSPPTLNFPVATGAVVQHIAGDTPYGPSDQSVLDALRALAESIGWVIRWRHFDATPTDWKWTVFQPSRSKTVADHTFATSAYWDVTQLRQELADIRNVIEVEYVGEGGSLESVQYPDEANVATDPSVVKYGRLYGKIAEESGSPVNNAVLARAMAVAAYNDLSEPDALFEISCRYFWPGEIGVDLYTFTANNVHFATDQTLAAMAFSHRIAVGERPTTKILCRGNPSGGVLMWRRKQFRTDGAEVLPPAIRRVWDTESTDRTTRNFTVAINATCQSIHVYYRTVTINETLDGLDFSSNAAGTPTFAIYSRVSGTDKISFTIPVPATGYRIAGRMIPYSAPDPDPTEGDSWPFTVEPAPLASAQGTVSIGENGAWSVTADGPSDALSFRWSSSTSSYPADATVTASGTLVTGTGRLLAISGGAALTFGQTIYVTIIPFDAVSGGGNALPSIHLRGSYQSFTASKTTSYDPSGWQVRPIPGLTTVDGYRFSTVGTTAGWAENLALAAPSSLTQLGLNVLIPAGVTVTGVAVDVYDNAAGDADFSVTFVRHDGSADTTLGSAFSTDAGGSQTLSFVVSETTNGRSYRVGAQMNAGTVVNEAAGTFRVGAGRITYTQANPSTSV